MTGGNGTTWVEVSKNVCFALYDLPFFSNCLWVSGGCGNQCRAVVEMNWRQAGGGGSMIGKLLKVFVFTIFV